jgi:thiamine biosynthesis lipoprotein
MERVILARHAMATRFEMVLHGRNPVALRAAGEEALDQIERLDAQLNLYNPASEISHINTQAATGPVRAEPGLFRLLQHAQRLSQETAGAFDITVASLMRCWGFMRDTGRMPSAEAVAEARADTGMQHVHLNERDFTVRFDRAGIMLDLGAIGKGYALDRAAEIIREAGVTSAMLHGGTSTAYAIGAPPDAQGWKVAVARPELARAEHAGQVSSQSASGASGNRPLAVVSLKDESLSMSAVWGKCFEAGGRMYGHVIDPRKGEPTDGALLAVVVLPSAAETDALSTALLISGVAGHDAVVHLRPGMRTLVVGQGSGPGEYQVAASGITASGV